MGASASLPTEVRWKDDTFTTPDQIRDVLVKTHENVVDTSTEECNEKNKDVDTNAENLALRSLHVLKHDPPQFRYFDPEQTERRPVWIKEVKLPRAKQTHEICFDPINRYVFVSQMSSSVLVRIKVRDDGFLEDDQDAWTIGKMDNATGEGISGLHNISLSYKHPYVQNKSLCTFIYLTFRNTHTRIQWLCVVIATVCKHIATCGDKNNDRSKCY